jgi:hypothetical protein
MKVSGGPLKYRFAWLLVVLVAAPVCVNAQWALYRDPPFLGRAMANRICRGRRALSGKPI